MNSRMNRRELLSHINQVSFAVDEVKLYLDTHPCDTEALAYFKDYKPPAEPRLEGVFRELRTAYGRHSRCLL